MVAFFSLVCSRAYHEAVGFRKTSLKISTHLAHLKSLFYCSFWFYLLAVTISYGFLTQIKSPCQARALEEGLERPRDNMGLDVIIEKKTLSSYSEQEEECMQILNVKALE